MADSGSPAAGEAQRKWKLVVLSYAKKWKQYGEQLAALGRDSAGRMPRMLSADPYLGPWRSALEAINRPGVTAAEREQFRSDWPVSHEALLPLLDEEAQTISTVALLDDGTAVVRVGTYYETGRVVRIIGERVEAVPGIDLFGRCPARRYFAVAGDAGIVVTDGWQGAQVARMAWPAGLEGRPRGARLVPFPEGRRVLLISMDGIFVLDEDGAFLVRAGAADDDDDDAVCQKPALWMAHGAVSPDGKWIATGDQSSRHLVLDADLNEVARIGPENEYPSFAMFSSDSSMLLLNACHHYHGTTIGVSVDNLPGLDTGFYANDPRTPVLQQGARLYAAVHRGDEFIIGDADGCVRAFSETGEQRWYQFIGATIEAIDVSSDGKTMLVASSAGYLSIYALDAGTPAPWQLGNGGHRELQRWLFWRSAAKPLLW